MLLTDAQATVAAIRERFEELATASAEDVVVVALCATKAGGLD
jgi:hypothetical protein